MTTSKSSKGTRVLIKICLILLLVLLLMIPTQFVRGVIMERKHTKAQIENEVAQSWGERQTLSCPILSIPFVKKTEIEDDNGNKKIKNYNRTLHLVPKEYEADILITPDSRKRSIYTVLLYKSSSTQQGFFDLSNITFKENEHPDYDNVSISLGISDISAIENSVELQLNGTPVRLRSGSEVNILGQGISGTTSINPKETILNYEYNLDLKGFEKLSILPLAENTLVTMNSPWPSPSFEGASSPESSISTKGFSAKWNINEYGRTNTPMWKDGGYIADQRSIFGVKLIQPVDEYAKNDRSTKYALLIITTVFLIFFFYEIMNNHRIHPIQYALIGLSLSLFYLLLLSLSEHIGFDRAYLVASIATIGLILGYSAAILQNKKTLNILAISLVALFVYIFVILQLEDYALLAGSLGLFTILAIVMYLSKKINWYEVGD